MSWHDRRPCFYAVTYDIYICTCREYKWMHGNEITYDKNCKNCYGFGHPPISMGELQWRK